MTSSTRTSELKQDLEALARAKAIDIDIYEQFVPKRIIIEPREEGNPVAEATLTRNGKNFVEFENYIQWDSELSQLQDGSSANVSYMLPRKVMAKSQIASIQSLDGVLGKRKYREVFDLK